MSTNGVNIADDAEMADCEGEKVVTMMDVLQEQQEFEDDANAVLGASDDKNCTYSKGYIKRQAIYACLTCCEDARTDPTKRAGVCLACSLNCHENHELIELYTKRNFRCDCGNPKFNNHPCQYVPEKTNLNEDNCYNQNFSGLYCTCHRPYPDPEATFEDEMIQCIICEDWLHAAHLEASLPTNEQYSEMICKACMEKNEFLHDYSEIAVNPETADVDIVTLNNADTSVTNEASECNGEVEKINGDLEDTNHIKPDEDIVDQTENNEAKVKEEDTNHNKPEEDIVDQTENNEAKVKEEDTNHIKPDEDIVDQTENNEAKVKEDDTNHNKPDEDIVDQTENNEAKVKEVADTTTDDKVDTEPEQVKNTEEEVNDIISTPDDNSEAETNNDTANENTDMSLVEEKNPSCTQESEIDKKAEEPGTQDCVTESSTNNDNSDETNTNNEEIPKANDSSTEEKPTEPVDVNNDNLLIESIEKLESELGNIEPKEISEENKVSNETEPDCEIDSSDNNKEIPTNESSASPEKTGTEDKDSIAVAAPSEDVQMEPDSKVESKDSIEYKVNDVEMTEDKTDTIEPENNVSETSDQKEALEIVHNGSNEVNLASNDSESKGEQDTKDIKRKLSTEESEEITFKRPKLDSCLRPQGVKTRFKGATFWPSNFRQKLCTCCECIAMYKDLSVLFLVDPEDTVTAYETLGKEKTDGTAASQYEKGLEALSSLGRIQQINALTEYNKMRDKLLDFLKSFKERKEIVKEEDIKAFFAGMKPKREPDGVYFCR